MKQLDPLVDFDGLYAEFGKPLFSFCLRLMGNRQEAEDLTQDVFVAAFEGKERFRGDSGIRTWLWRIAIYRARERHRRLRRYRWFQKEATSTPTSIDTRLDLDWAIDQLPEKLKLAFILTKVEGMTISEAASILEIPEGTVKYHVFEAVSQLKSALGSRENTNVISPEEKTTYAM